ncbi:hypothetical protein [Streptomyces sp. NPDC005423]|uniref:hypothetical protein n=1 Tax=Streptomyces sp. NPDC005423 TaxID=3155343 RepID=UPI0033AD7D18
MTEKLLSPLRTRPWPERWLTRALGAAVASAAYLVCGPLTGASAAGALVLLLILLPLAAYVGHRDDLAWPLLQVALPPAAFMYDSVPAAYANWPDDTVRPLQWAFATLVIATAVLVAATVGRRLRPRAEDSTDGLLTAPRP